VWRQVPGRLYPIKMEYVPPTADVRPSNAEAKELALRAGRKPRLEKLDVGYPTPPAKYFCGTMRHAVHSAR
jgi:hypothetical protein